MGDLDGKHVVVTGATGGLGISVVEQLLADGATVHVPMVEAAMPTLLPWARHAGVVGTPGVGMSDEAAVTGYYAALPGLWASVHLVGGFAMTPIAETSLADFEKMHAMNAVTCFLACREAVRAIRRSGGGGRIVNVAARAALAPPGGMLPYVASKGAVVAITQALAAEVLDEQILVNAIAPSIIDTPANRAAMPTADVARWPKPAELAAAIGFLVSPGNRLTSGAIVPVYGRG